MKECTEPTQNSSSAGRSLISSSNKLILSGRHHVQQRQLHSLPSCCSPHLTPVAGLHTEGRTGARSLHPEAILQEIGVCLWDSFAHSAL